VSAENSCVAGASALYKPVRASRAALLKLIDVTITFINNDSGVPHNIAFCTSSSAATVIYKGENILGVSNITYTFDAPTTPGTYFFRCDIHPSTMTGEFIVQ